MTIQLQKSPRWHSARKKRPEPVKHAPNPTIELRKYPYCSEFGASKKDVAQEGERVTCKCCLKKLRQAPQYANYLYTMLGIDARGTVWSNADGSVCQNTGTG